jgi:UMF1 family MFS transporter
LGAALFAWLDDKLGSRTTMLLALIGLIITTTGVLIVTELIWFWGFGLVLGIFVGPVQAASRTYMARVSPPNLENQMFGLMALSGKVTSFIGPLLVGWLTYIADSQRIGMSVIVVLFIIGFVTLYFVPDAEDARPEE